MWVVLTITYEKGNKKFKKFEFDTQKEAINFKKDINSISEIYETSTNYTLKNSGKSNI